MNGVRWLRELLNKSYSLWNCKNHIYVVNIDGGLLLLTVQLIGGKGSELRMGNLAYFEKNT